MDTLVPLAENLMGRIAVEIEEIWAVTLQKNAMNLLTKSFCNVIYSRKKC